jgi:hypothetical protein
VTTLPAMWARVDGQAVRAAGSVQQALLEREVTLVDDGRRDSVLLEEVEGLSARRVSAYFRGHLVSVVDEGREGDVERVSVVGRVAGTGPDVLERSSAVLIGRDEFRVDDVDVAELRDVAAATTVWDPSRDDRRELGPVGVVDGQAVGLLSDLAWPPSDGVAAMLRTRAGADRMVGDFASLGSESGTARLNGDVVDVVAGDAARSLVRMRPGRTASAHQAMSMGGEGLLAWVDTVDLSSFHVLQVQQDAMAVTQVLSGTYGFWRDRPYLVDTLGPVSSDQTTSLILARPWVPTGHPWIDSPDGRGRVGVPADSVTERVTVATTAVLEGHRVRVRRPAVIGRSRTLVSVEAIDAGELPDVLSDGFVSRGGLLRSRSRTAVVRPSDLTHVETRIE